MKNDIPILSVLAVIAAMTGCTTPPPANDSAPNLYGELIEAQLAFGHSLCDAVDRLPCLSSHREIGFLATPESCLEIRGAQPPLDFREQCISDAIEEHYELVEPTVRCAIAREHAFAACVDAITSCSSDQLEECWFRAEDRIHENFECPQQDLQNIFDSCSRLAMPRL